MQKAKIILAGQCNLYQLNYYRDFRNKTYITLLLTFFGVASVNQKCFCSITKRVAASYRKKATTANAAKSLEFWDLSSLGCSRGLPKIWRASNVILRFPSVYSSRTAVEWPFLELLFWRASLLHIQQHCFMSYPFRRSPSSFIF